MVPERSDGHREWLIVTIKRVTEGKKIKGTRGTKREEAVTRIRTGIVKMGEEKPVGSGRWEPRGGKERRTRRRKTHKRRARPRTGQDWAWDGLDG
jgi:hypothetical protein